mgnify:CR=1 FL=1
MGRMSKKIRWIRKKFREGKLRKGKKRVRTLSEAYRMATTSRR